VHVCHGVIPGLSGVGIEVPSVLLFGSSPVGDTEALEDSTGLSVETDISDTFENCGGMEVLSVNVVHDVRLLVEFVSVNILNAKAYIIIN
jgi:hypothetical protein